MIYRVGGTIKAKKPHACGANEWKVMRTGADVKLKCTGCGRLIFLSIDEVAKMTASYADGESDGEN